MCSSSTVSGDEGYLQDAVASRSESTTAITGYARGQRSSHSALPGDLGEDCALSPGSQLAFEIGYGHSPLDDDSEIVRLPFDNRAQPVGEDHQIGLERIAVALMGATAPEEDGLPLVRRSGKCLRQFIDSAGVTVLDIGGSFELAS